MSAPQKQSNIRSTPTQRATRTNASAYMRSSRTFYFLFSILVFAVLTFFAHRQPPRPDPFQPVQTLSWDWWQYPLERNAFKRLPVITSDLNDVFALPNSEKVWAVGDEGMIVHSDDGGEKWVQQPIEWKVLLTDSLLQAPRSATSQEAQFDSPSRSIQKGLDSNQNRMTNAKKAKDDNPQKPSGFWYARAESLKNTLEPNWDEISDSYMVALLLAESPQDRDQAFKGAKEAVRIRSLERKARNAIETARLAITSEEFAKARKVFEFILTVSRYLTASLSSVYFTDLDHGWAVSYGGTILFTNNGGSSWQEQASGTTKPLHSVHFIDVATGWAVGVAGTILVTKNGGVTWQTQESGTKAVLHSVHFVNATTGWAVGNDGIILETQDGGQTWMKQNSGIFYSLYSVHFLNAREGWVVSGEGTILATYDSGQTWVTQTSGTSTPFDAVYFVNASTGWIVGRDGTTLATQDGGRAWKTQRHVTSVWLSSVYFATASNGWAVGDTGTILATTDGGETWVLQTRGRSTKLDSSDALNEAFPYSLSFAPWYYLSLLLLAPLLYLAFRKPKPIEAEQKTVADMLVSDRPIAAGDPDPLEFNSIARGLSRFLRNENTQPALTIAITGEWGSGKSSLMNLLKADLERYGFRPVWFNAWHHQKEEHLLAALLQNIRKQALPRWWRPEGMSFRARLFWRRVRRYRVLALFMLAGFAVAVGYFAADYATRLHEAVKQIEHLFEGEAKIEHTILGWLQHKLAALGKTSVLALLSSLGAALLVLWRGLRAFGVNPANLMASLSSNFKLSEAKAQMGFRHDFAKEFSEVTAALNPRTMLILIDDLDRCRPENVLDVLEAVNFLVSSGDCYVVMGLDLTRVERCVGLGFKDVAEELVDDLAPDNSEKEEARLRREKFARQYLEKLINIEVPVPKPEEKQSQSLIVPPKPAAAQPLLWWQNLLQMSAPKVRMVAPWLLAITVLAAGIWFGKEQFPKENGTQSTTNIAQPTTKPTPSSNQPAPSTTTAQPTRSEVRADSSRGTGELIQPQKEPASFAFVYVALAIMIVLAIWRLSILPDPTTQDSPEFIDALKIWHPLLIAKRNTPRSVKRFVNRVRYFAMRQSAETEAQNVWQKLAVWAGSKQKEEVKQVDAVPESILVALSAIHHVDPEWLSKAGGIYSSEKGFQIAPEGVIGGSELKINMPGASAMYEAIKNHTERFQNWPPNKDDRDRLEKLSAGIRIN